MRRERGKVLLGLIFCVLFLGLGVSLWVSEKEKVEIVQRIDTIAARQESTWLRQFAELRDGLTTLLADSDTRQIRRIDDRMTEAREAIVSGVKLNGKIMRATPAKMGVDLRSIDQDPHEATPE